MQERVGIFKIAFDYFTDPIFFCGSRGVIIYGNPAFQKFITDNLDISNSIDAIATICPQFEKSPPQGIWQTEFVAGKRRVPMRLELIPIEGDIVMVRLMSDSSDDGLQNNLHTQRVNTLGMLAGGIAHDFNNILTGFLGHITYLNTILPQAGSHIQSLAALEEGAKKASSLTQGILRFSRSDAGERPENIDLSDLVKKTFNLLRGAISPEYELSFSVPETPVHVLASEAKLSQVLVNLVMNARDAIDSGGHIQIKVSVHPRTKEIECAFGTEDLSSEKYAQIIVQDDGHGMPKEIQERIFEPYYSTKKDKGTGLGLAIVNEIVHMCAGVIDVSSQVGKGTSITVYLPLLVGGDTTINTSQKSESRVSKTQGGQERILVVDDEYPVRNVLSLSLEHLGYEVEIAASGAEAIERFNSNGAPIDLVILDMLMPNLSGDQTFFKLKEIDPSVKVLVISGFASQDAVDSILDNGGLGFVQKPFTIVELAKRVRQCFES